MRGCLHQTPGFSVRAPVAGQGAHAWSMALPALGWAVAPPSPGTHAPPASPPQHPSPPCTGISRLFQGQDICGRSRDITSIFQGAEKRKRVRGRPSLPFCFSQQPFWKLPWPHPPCTAHLAHPGTHRAGAHRVAPRCTEAGKRCLFSWAQTALKFCSGDRGGLGI